MPANAGIHTAVAVFTPAWMIRMNSPAGVVASRLWMPAFASMIGGEVRAGGSDATGSSARKRVQADGQIAQEAGGEEGAGDPQQGFQNARRLVCGGLHDVTALFLKWPGFER